MASEVVRHGGVAVCAAVSPYRGARNEVRSMIAQDRFIEVWVDTSLEVCEQRDAKGIYAQARLGKLEGVTGIDDPYEPPLHPELVLDTIIHTPEDNALLILNYLIQLGLVCTNEPRSQQLSFETRD